MQFGDCMCIMEEAHQKMSYRSTRGRVCNLSFQEALLSGYATDGGLLLPDLIPQVGRCLLSDWKELSYVELSKEIMSLFIPTDEIPRKDLSGNASSKSTANK